MGIHNNIPTSHKLAQNMFVNTRIYHECEGGIDKSVPSITVWSYEVCTVMTTDNPEVRIFLSHTHTNSRFFFLLINKFNIFIFKKALRSYTSRCDIKITIALCPYVSKENSSTLHWTSNRITYYSRSWSPMEECVAVHCLSFPGM